MTLLNPLGLLALLAIPIVIAIHFLQRRSQNLPISTLFLLQKTQKESASGQKFDRLMNSVPLWLQLLIVCLITWLLVQPRYIKANSTQRIAIVLDSSASMSVFKNEVRSKLESILPELQGNAEHAELWLLQSNATKARLYHGKDIAKLLVAIEQWQPVDGANDPNHGLRIARSLAGTEGAVVFLTDTPRESMPYNAHLYGIGSYKENCGFTGVSFSNNGTQLIWKTLVRNYSDQPITRTWYLENDKGQRTPEKTVSIQPRKLVSLQGTFPQNSKTAKLVLSKDNFALDDILPLVKPIPKSLNIISSNLKPLTKLAESIHNSFPNIYSTTQTSDADIQISDTALIDSLTRDSILFNQVTANPKSYLTGNIVAEKHPLMEGLNWQTLLIKDVPALSHTETDQVLLWQGKRPLIILRPLANKKQALLFNFAIDHSNVMKTEAMVVLLLRYIENIRDQKMSHQQLITETSQPLKLITPKVTKQSALSIESIAISHDKQNEKSTVTYVSNRKLYSPNHPCFFTIKHAGKPLLTAANYFADTREADFSQCAEAYVPASTNASAVDRHTKEDHLWRYWVGLALLAVLLSWHYVRRAG